MKPIWRDSTIEQQLILITLLGMANWQPSEYVFEGEVTILKPGEFVASIEDIRQQIDKTEVTTKKIRLAFERFKKLGFLSVRRVSRKAIAKSVVSIVNWQLYQIEEFEGKTLGKQNGKQKGKQETDCKALNNAAFDNVAEKIGQAEGQTKGQDFGQTSYYKRKDKEGDKNNIYITPRAHEQTQNQDQVNEGAADQYAGRVERCVNYYQSAIHGFFNLTERECVISLAMEYDEVAFIAAVDKAKANRINHTGTWKYVDKILRTGGVKDFSKRKTAADQKNDVVIGAEEAAALIESGEVIDL